MIIVSAAAALLACVLLLPAISDIVSLGVALVRGARRESRAQASPSRLLFLIPAHDEEELISECVRSVLAMRYPRDRIGVIVVADNCADRTAERARTAGATCLERRDPANRGKPRAIAWALGALSLRSWDAVVILDADAIVSPMYGIELDRAAPLRGKAVECYNGVRNPRESSITRMAAVFAASLFRGAFSLKRRAGLNVPLSAGMCIGSQVLLDHPWSAFGLSEDWELYAILTAAGVTIDLAPRARLFAQEAGSLRQAASQRSRWLSGRLAALARFGPALIASRRIGWRQKLDAVAELVSPGPAVQCAACCAAAGLLWLTSAPGAAVCSVALAASLLRPALFAMVGLAHDPEPLRAAAAFAFLPAYAVWRLAIAVRSMLPLGAREWVRTARS